MQAIGKKKKMVKINIPVDAAFSVNQFVDMDNLYKCPH